MSEQTKAPRAVSEIQNEYQNLCTKAGHINYQIFVLSNDLGLVQETLRDLNMEAMAAQKAEADKKSAEPTKE